MKYLKGPIWAICQYKDFIIVSGGGGGKKFGILNFISVYKPALKLENPIVEEDTEEDLVTSLDVSS